MIEGLREDEDGLHIAELEVSITARCSLACADCGFNVPRQPEPALGGDIIAELADGLAQLARLGVGIRSLAVLGGEPTLSGPLLERAVERFRAMPGVGRIEVVTNGLTPQGLTPRALRHIDRLSISLYVQDDALAQTWRGWLARVAPQVDLVLRDQREGWDPWTGDDEVDDAAAQAMYERCWYRKHCVTLERGRIFVCSRIAKSARDDEGLRLDHNTSLARVAAYLNGLNALRACRECTPMMGLPRVPAGVQPDDRLVRLERRAITWLRHHANEKKTP